VIVGDLITLPPTKSFERFMSTGGFTFQDWLQLAGTVILAVAAAFTAVAALAARESARASEKSAATAAAQVENERLQRHQDALRSLLEALLDVYDSTLGPSFNPPVIDRSLSRLTARYRAASTDWGLPTTEDLVGETWNTLERRDYSLLLDGAIGEVQAALLRGDHPKDWGPDRDA
jgi:type II secretory pathway pseudopilin PulG